MPQQGCFHPCTDHSGPCPWGGQQKAWVSFKHLRVMPRKNSGHTSQTAHHGVGGRLQTNWLHLFGSRVWPQGAIREVHGLTTWHFPDEDLLVWDRSRFETLHLEAQDALARWQGPWKRGVHVEACAQPEESGCGKSPLITLRFPCLHVCIDSV